VWVVREAIKKTLNNLCFTFESKEDMLKKGKEIILNKLGYDISEILQKSKVINNIKEQKKLIEFL
jgi:hypothetical protein